MRLSLSRLNHWLPGCEAYPEVVQGTAQFHHEITDTLLPQPNPVFHNATALHATVDMLDPQSTLVQRLVGSVLFSRQLALHKKSPLGGIFTDNMGLYGL